MPEHHLSVIIPAFNEEARIGNTITEIVAYLLRQFYAWDIIVVDDGSSDRTVQVAKEKLAGFSHVILENVTNRGKGYSVKRGMLEGKGKYLLFTDADLSTPIEELEKFLVYLEKDCDMVIGSRAVEGSQVEIHQPRFREIMGRIFNRIARLLAFRGIHDSQCGFKCFKREAAHRLFSRQKLDGFSFDAEILYLAQKEGYRIKEEPVIWRNSVQTRVQIATDPFRMLVDLIRIRRLHR